MSAPILGASAGTVEQQAFDVNLVKAAEFSWLHLQGTHYLRVKEGSTAGPDAVVTVVGSADGSNAANEWLLLG